MSKWIEKEIGELIIERPKSKIQVADATGFGEFPFFTSGDSVLLHNQKLTENENIYLATGGTANAKYYDGEAAFSTDTYVVSAKNGIDTKFLYYYLLKNLCFINNNFFEGSGLKHLQKNDLKEWMVSFPEDAEEQKQIAAILSKADELIEATQILIDKQKKVKTGLMQTLLTSGIDDKGVIRSPKTHKFKDSELGPIPEEWECVELGKILERGKGSMQTGPFGSSLHSNEYVDEGCSVIMPQDILHNEINWIEISHITEDKKTTLKRHIVNEHDVLFARRGDLSKCAVIMSHCDAICGTGCLLLRPNKAELNSLWLKNVYQQTKIQDQVTSMSVGTTMLNINAKILKSLVLAFPSLNEQNRIVSVLQQQDQIIKDLENEKQKYIDIKKGLMADLLTGKVKVSS